MNKDMNLLAEYEKPEMTLRCFLFNGDIATISDVNSSQGGSDISDNVTIAPDVSDTWWENGDI